MKNSFRFIDLFSGIGGMRLSFEKIGGDCVFSSEIDKNAKITYKANFKELPSGDIRKIKDIPDHDILLAGFPCQAFSYAGKKLGFKDKRGNLFFEILRILKDKKPKAFLLENVKGLLSINKRETFNFMISKLKEISYEVFYKVINTKDYSIIPQNRERIYIVGFKDKTSFRFPKPVKKLKKVKDFLLKNKQDPLFYYNRHSIYEELKKSIKKENTIYQWRRTYVRKNKNDLCPTLTANMGTGGHNVPLIKDQFDIRKLTPKECLNFQGFPNSFILPDIANSHLYKQIGNSVSIPVITEIAKEIKKCLKIS